MNRTHPSNQSRRRLWPIVQLIALIAAASLWTGCAEEVDEVPAESVAATATSLEVTPRVQLDGVTALESQVFLQELCLGVGEIRLEPMDPERDEVVYVTRTPMMLHFDVASGEHVLEGEAITLPHPGEFLIEIRLEPMSVGDDTLDGRAVRLDGLVAKESGGEGDEPMPLPWLVQNDSGSVPGVTQKPVEWVPWTYSSERSTSLSLNTVEFSDEPEQLLVISLDMARWLDGAMAPIQAAVDDQRATSPDAPGGELTTPAPIDVSGDLEEEGADFESLIARSEARDYAPRGE